MTTRREDGTKVERSAQRAGPDWPVRRGVWLQRRSSQCQSWVQLNNEGNQQKVECCTTEGDDGKLTKRARMSVRRDLQTYKPGTRVTLLSLERGYQRLGMNAKWRDNDERWAGERADERGATQRRNRRATTM